MPFRPFMPKGEFTNVGLETEVKIPWESYKKLLILGPVSIWCLWIVGWLIWLRVEMESMSAWRWASREWWPWFKGGGWIWPAAICFLWWASAPTWATIYRFMIETVIKNPPMYDNAKAENGMWHPFVGWRRRRIENANLRNTYREKFGGEK